MRFVGKRPHRGGVRGLDLWFQQDVARILASTHEAMAASMRATAPLDAEMAQIYQQGFWDALQAVAVAFGVAGPNRDGSGMRAMAHVEAQQPALRFLEAGEWR
jgi:hypothetical protein